MFAQVAPVQFSGGSALQILKDRPLEGRRRDGLAGLMQREAAGKQKGPEP